MTPRDSGFSSPTPMTSTNDADVWAGRSVPRATSLSTLWEGPADSGSSADDKPSRRSRVLDWLLAPANKRRVLVVTTVAALVCAGALTVGETSRSGDPDTPQATASDQRDTRADLTSEAVVVAPGEAEIDDAVRSAGGAVVGATVSADDRLRLVAESLASDPESWLLSAEVLDGVDSGEDDAVSADPVVRFTVNGVVIEEVDQPPYRLMLNPEILASFESDGSGRAQAIVVTATAQWSAGDSVASPATIILQD